MIDHRLNTPEGWDHLAALLHCLPSVLWSCTADFRRAIYLSPNARGITGLEPGDLERDPGRWFLAIHPRDRARVRTALGALKQEGQLHVEYRFVRPDGETRWSHDRMRVVRDADGHPLRVDGLSTDFTAQMQELGRHTTAIAHDFRNVLSVLMGYTSLLDSRLRAADLEGHEVDGIRRATDHATDLTKRLETLGRDASAPRCFDLNRLVAQVAETLPALIGDEIDVDVDLDETLGEVFADPADFEQVLVDLALNAGEAMPDGGMLSLETRNAGTEWVELIVADTGRGMDEATRARALEPFFSTKPGGGGLGLANVCTIVDRAGGQVFLDTAPRLGTAFVLRLPRYRAGVRL